MGTQITYNGETIATLTAGQKATLHCKGDNVKMLSDIVVNVPVSEVNMPTEVSTEAEMNAFLESGTVGSVYKYTGESTDTYENGAYYVLEVEETDADGHTVTITFPDGSGEGAWYSTTIYDDYRIDGNRTEAAGNVIGTISSAIGSVTVTTTTGKVYIDARGENPAQNDIAADTFSLQGSVREIPEEYSIYINISGTYGIFGAFEVYGDGSIEVTEIDWNG